MSIFPPLPSKPVIRQTPVPRGLSGYPLDAISAWKQLHEGTPCNYICSCIDTVFFNSWHVYTQPLQHRTSHQPTKSSHNNQNGQTVQHAKPAPFACMRACVRIGREMFLHKIPNCRPSFVTETTTSLRSNRIHRPFNAPPKQTTLMYADYIC